MSGATLSSSSRVNGFLSSVNWSGDQPPRLKTHLPGARRLGLGADHLERLLARVDAVEAQLERPVGALLLEVRVVVDDSGNHRPAAQVDALRVRTRQPL